MNAGLSKQTIVFCPGCTFCVISIATFKACVIFDMLQNDSSSTGSSALVAGKSDKCRFDCMDIAA